MKKALISGANSVFNQALLQKLVKRWHQKAVDKSDYDELTPQDIQNKYPKYQELVDDMLGINEELVQYTDQLKKLIDA